MRNELEEEFEKGLRDYIDAHGWDALERFIVENMGFELVETKRIYKKPGDKLSHITITEGTPTPPRRTP